MIKLIGIAGKAGTGKDTVGFYLEDVWGYRTYAFAEPIKHGLRELFNLNEAQLFGGEKETVIPSYGKSPRQMMQSMGDWGKSIHPDLWLMMAGRMLAKMDHYETLGHPGVVITDVRYENEAAFVRERGGVIIHIDRGSALPVHEHSSEHGITGRRYSDICIQNNGSLEDLYCKISDVMDRFGDKASA